MLFVELLLGCNRSFFRFFFGSIVVSSPFSVFADEMVDDEEDEEEGGGPSAEDAPPPCV